MKGLTLLVLSAILGTTTNCSSPSGPLPLDVYSAHATWLKTHPRAYTFEIETQSAWIRNTGYLRIQVSGDSVVSATSETGVPVAGWTTTIDTIWARILQASQDKTLGAASFDARGVPVEVD